MFTARYEMHYMHLNLIFRLIHDKFLSEHHYQRNGSCDNRFRIQKRHQLNVGSLNLDSGTQNRPSLSDCIIRLTAVRRSGHWLQSRLFMAVRWLHRNQTASCFDCWELCSWVGYRRKCQKRGGGMAGIKGSMKCWRVESCTEIEIQLIPMYVRAWAAYVRLRCNL
jgi:hypothetical protein